MNNLAHLLLLSASPTVALKLSAATITDTALAGDIIGTLSVTNGTGFYTYTLTSNPGALFSISGSSLEVAGPLMVGSDSITVHADNGSGSIINRTFLITVTASGFNGGKSQVNFGVIETHGEYPFINVVKTIESWSRGDTNQLVDASTLDANGYPMSTPPGVSIFGHTFIPDTSIRPGDYVGYFTVSAPGAVCTAVAWGTLTSAPGSNTSNGAGVGPFRYQFTPNPGGQITAMVQNFTGGYINSFALMHINDEAKFLAGEVFGTQFLLRIRQAKFGVFRGLDWGPYNTTQCTTWATRKPITHCSYLQSEFRSDYYSGATTGAGASGCDLTLSAPPINSATGAAWAGLQDKSTVIFRTAHSVHATVNLSFTASSTSVGATAHGLSVGQRVNIFNGNDSPTYDANFPANDYRGNVFYWVKTVPDANHVTLSATNGGAAIAAVSTLATSVGVTMTAQMTFNVGGTGAKDVLQSGASLLWSPLNTVPFAGNDAYGTMVYDADLDRWLLTGGSSFNAATGASNISALGNGVPPEVMFQLAAECKAHPWFPSPPYALDPMTDYIPSLAAYCAANQPSWMIPRYETPNELWNFNFNTTGLAIAKAIKHWGASISYNDWCGKIASTLGQAVASAYGIAKANIKTTGLTKYQVVVGNQAAIGNPIFGGSVIGTSNDERLASTLYVAQAAAAQSGSAPNNFGTYVKEAANGWVNAICFANYLSPTLYNQPGEATLATNWTAANGNPTLQATYAATYVDSLGNESGGGFSVASIQTTGVNFKAWAAHWGIPIMCFYEGGYSPDYDNDANRNVIRRAGKQSPNLQGYLTSSYNGLVGLSDGSVTVQFPSCYELGGQPLPSQQVWPVLEDVYQSPDPPQWLAIVAFNA